MISSRLFVKIFKIELKLKKSLELIISIFATSISQELFSLFFFNSKFFSNIFFQLSLIFAEKPGTDQLIYTTTSLFVSLCYFLLVFLFGTSIRIKFKYFISFLFSNFQFFGQLILGFLAFSNSFIIYESDVLQFSIQSLILIALIIHLNIYRLIFEFFKNILLKK